MVVIVVSAVRIEDSGLLVGDYGGLLLEVIHSKDCYLIFIKLL